MEPLPPLVRDPVQDTPIKEKNAVDSDGFTEVRSKKRERRSTGSQGTSSPEISSERKKNKRDNYNETNEERNSTGRREDEQNQREDSPTNNLEPSQPTGAIRLLFPSECKFTVQEKVLWTVKLAREHRAFAAILRDGRTRPYITVKTQEAADFLINEGYEGLKLVAPESGVKTTKIIIFRYPEYLDEEFVLDDPRILWARRNKLRGVERCQVIALIKGDAPRRIFVNGLGFRPVAQYIEEPRMCLRCSKWGHDSWSCQSDPRCRFCGRPHISTLCGDRIRQQARVIPRCANCRGSHNARSSDCPFHPRARRTQGGSAPPVPAGQKPQHQGVTRPAPLPSVNAWGQGRPLLPGEERTAEPETRGEEEGERGDASGGAVSHTPDGPDLVQLPTAVRGECRDGEKDTPHHTTTTTTTTTPPPATAPLDSKCGCAATQDNSVLIEMMTKMCQKMESLEGKIKELERRSANEKEESKSEKKSEEMCQDIESLEEKVVEVERPNTSEREESKKEKKIEEIAQRKVVISGKEKVLKPLRVLNGLEVVEKAIVKCGDDESKKNKVFKGWIEAHKVLERILSEMENIAGSPLDSVSE